MAEYDYSKTIKYYEIARLDEIKKILKKDGRDTLETKDIMRFTVPYLLEVDRTDNVIWLANALKYLLRCAKKGQYQSDIKKAHSYLGWVIKSWEEEK